MQIDGFCNSLVLFGQYFNAGFGNQNHVFYLGGETVVDGVYGPVVVFVDEKVGTPLVDHRFDGEHHAGNKNHLAAFRSDIADEWLFMKIKADAVAAYVLYYGITMFTGMGIDGVCDIAEMSPGFCGF